MLVYESGDRKMNLKISAERGDGMLNYLEQGMILYVMAAVCVIGVISRFAANRCYKSLIRQSDNLAAAKDKQLQQNGTTMSFEVQGFEDSQITVELEAETEYQVFIDGASTGTMTTNLGGKLSFSVELDANTKAEVKIVKC